MNKTVTPEGEQNHYELTQEEFDAGLTAALLTGPISGTISLSDGAAYDVTEDWIACREEHVGPLQHHIHKRHLAAGKDVPAHECDEGCGFEQGK
jgi:hypothetical protein